MSVISAMPGEIVEWLGGQQVLSGITFLTEFPSVKKAVPLKSTIVAVGIEGMTITDSFTENAQGELVENEYCRDASIKIKLSIHAPFSLGGAACHDAFTDVLDCLTFASDFDIVESGCDSITADRDTDAFVLHAWISVSAQFCPAASSSVSFASFINKDLLCGTHINNGDIHLSAEQKSYIDEPIVTGSYFGTGETVRNIALGFRARAVIVFAGSFPPMQVNHANSTNTTFFSVATGTEGAQGLSITNTGFKLSSGQNYALRGSTPQLNELAITYYYLAFK